MRKEIETWQIVRRFVAQLKQTFEKPEHALGESSPNCPTLKFQEKDRIVFCMGIALHLSPLLWWLLFRLSQSVDGTLDFTDSCIDEKIACPWRVGAGMLDSSKRCTACRLSTKLWEAGLPYRVQFSQVKGCFLLILLDENERQFSVVAVSSSEFLTNREARNVKQLVKTLILLLPVLQFSETHDLGAERDTILPILSELPELNLPQDS